MKNSLKRLNHSFKIFVLGLLGFAGCKDGPIDAGPEALLCMYGTPHGEFRVEINVTDEIGDPLKDIEVSPVLLHAPNYDITREELETVKTDDNGKASKTYENWWVDDVRVIFEDKAGEYLKDSIDFKPVITKEGDNHWYLGEKTVSGTAKMRKK